MIKGTFLYDEIRVDGKYKVYEIDLFGDIVETMIRESDKEMFFSSADVLRMCQLANRGSYSSNLISNANEVIRNGRKTYIDSMAMFSYIFKGRNEGIMIPKKKFLKFFVDSIELSE